MFVIKLLLKTMLGDKFKIKFFLKTKLYNIYLLKNIDIIHTFRL